MSEVPAAARGVGDHGGGDALVLRARAGLLRAFEPPDSAVAEHVARVGVVAAWRGVRDRRAPRSVLAPTAARTEGRSAEQLDDQADADLAVAAAVGARLIGAGDAEWPEAALLALALATGRGVKNAAPPVALYVRGGSLARLPRRGVAVVGSRANTAYGQRVAADIAVGAADAGMTVVSGAAFGIDTVAHRAALACVGGLPTVAVLACGIDRAYPVANTQLIDRVAGAGAVVSEYPPGSSPARHRFLVRNRLIAALSAGTVVVEAGRRSGTLSTAGAARMLGRVVMAVPGPVTSALSVGCHLLLSSDAALLVTGPGDVLGLVDPDRGADTTDQQAPPTSVPVDRRHPTDGLDPQVARVYEALPFRGGRTITELSVESGLPATTVMEGLAVLELHDLARRDSGAWRRIRTTEQS